MTEAIKAMRYKKIEKLGAFAVFWIVVTSGGVFLNSKAIVNYVLLFDVALIALLLGGVYRKVFRQHFDVLVFFFLLAFLVLLSMVANSDFSSLLTYVRLMLMLVFAMATALTLDAEKIAAAFVKTVLFIASFSVIFFYTDVIKDNSSLFPIIEFYENRYINAIVYLHFESIEPRNFGIYIEPGLYQIYLNVALFLVLNTSRYIPRRLLYAGVLLAAIYSTQSTTGYVAAAIIVARYGFVNESRRSRNFTYFFRVVFVTLFIGLVVTSDFFSKNLEEKFITTNQLSFNTRVNSTLIDIELIADNPAFGIGVGNYKESITAFDASGLVIDAATNTFTQVAALVGLPFIFLVMLGAFRYLFLSNVAKIDKAMIAFMYLLFFSTQPLILYPLFYLPAFMGFMRSRQPNDFK